VCIPLYYGILLGVGTMVDLLATPRDLRDYYWRDTRSLYLTLIVACVIGVIIVIAIEASKYASTM
tara:strand:- start:50 stop:244 length:195 start_codon:yes stop_codon:yes gene_type:complete